MKSGACCTLHAARCTLFATCCMSSTAWRMCCLHVVLLHAACRPLHFACCALHVAWCLLHILL
jgi:hypothetical protein